MGGRTQAVEEMKFFVMIIIMVRRKDPRSPVGVAEAQND